jgi:tRNA(Arg) A34 adenosine deaminase TadA
VDAIAAVTLSGRTYYSRYRVVEGAPHSAVTQLVQGIWEAHPAQARAILRKRIHSTAPLRPLDWGMVKTAAQRISVVTAIDIQAAWEPVAFQPSYLPPMLEPAQLEQDPMALARGLSSRARREADLYRSDRPVGCVLVSADGRILHWAENRNRANRTLHAEVNLVQSWWSSTGRSFPAGAKIITTLEPCRMCQGMIFTICPDIEVLYGDADGVPEVTWPIKCARY